MGMKPSLAPQGVGRTKSQGNGLAWCLAHNKLLGHVPRQAGVGLTDQMAMATITEVLLSSEESNETDR